LSATAQLFFRIKAFLINLFSSGGSDAPLPATVAAVPRRYFALDGMRGIAAAAVILVHTASSIAPAWSEPHFGFLAVDLFFLLSGFVLAYSYDRAFARGMTAIQFMRKRFVRLYPLFALGLILGLGLRIIPTIRDATTTGGAMSGHEMIISSLFNAFMLPAPNGEHNHFVFPADLPAWSLFLEIWVANLMFACLWKRLQGRTLAVFIGAMVLLGLANEAVFHTWSVGAVWSNFVGGFVRVGFSFMVGVALARIHASRPPRLPVPCWLIWAALLALLFAPLSHGVGHAYELICVFILFPALIYFGAEGIDKRPWIGSALGEASYGAYTLHIPLLSLLCYLVPAAILRPSPLYGIAFALGVILLSLPVAYFYDKPVQLALGRMVL
jgi:peptidoglycan/LPS O-acetylase OafA/YrhL